MGRRLEFTVDIPEGLRDARMPSMVLLTLVENAIKHGLNPLPQGGLIRIAARALADKLSPRSWTRAAASPRLRRRHRRGQPACAALRAIRFGGIVGARSTPRAG
jgi:hypothetical protein